MRPIVELNEYLSLYGANEYEYLLTAPGYENRSIESALEIIRRLHLKKAILLDIGDDYLDTPLKRKKNENKKLTIDMLKQMNIPFSTISCAPSVVGDAGQRVMREIGKNKNVIINITSLPKNYVLALAKIFDDESNSFFYQRGYQHVPSADELLTGIDSIETIEGFEGDKKLEVDDLLVLLLGYEGHRASSFLARFSPAKILPIIGVPGVNKEEDELFVNKVIESNYNLLRKHNVLRDGDGNFYTAPSLDPEAFFYRLEEIIKSLDIGDFDVTISPIGTRPQTLGLYLYCRKHPETQAIYSVPIKRFDINESNGQEKKFFIYKLPPS
jgi:hypothetical protein